jgi:tetratricopeptide (TPR) repeat protein
MSLNTASSYNEDPQFHSALRHFQLGEWSQGLTVLEDLVREYPLDRELRELRHDMHLRARIDKDEREDISRNRMQRIKTISIRVAVLGLIAAVLFFGIQTYSSWIQEQFISAQQNVQQEMAVVELAVKFRDAQDLLQADRPDAALAKFEEVKAEDPNYPGLEENMQLAREKALVDLKYEEAMRLKNLGELAAAQTKLEEIQSEAPLYKDVAQQITTIQMQFDLENQISQANSAFEESRWEDAVTAYEELRQNEPNYKADFVEDRLFQSYVNAAEAASANQDDSLEALQVVQDFFKKALAMKPQDPDLKAKLDAARGSIEDRLVRNYLAAAQLALADSSDSLDALEIAESFWSKALELRPDSPQIQLQQELAHKYLAAQANFTRGRWTDVIEDLEFVYAEEMDYANGTARQTLFDAYLSRGDSQMARGEYGLALSDYQRAAVLAEDDPSSALRMYEAQIDIANAHGALGEYETAVYVYRNAIEMGDLRNRNLDQHTELAALLTEADAYALAGNYRTAYRSYREALRRSNETYDTVTHKVQSGEYLTMIAARYGSTVQAIARANDIADPNRIYTGQELLIPVIK